MLKVIKNSTLVPTPIVNLTLEDSANLESTDPITARGVAKCASDIFDDGQETGFELSFDTADAYNTYKLGKYYVIGEKIFVCTTRSKTGDSAPYTYEVVLTKLNGVVESLNYLADRVKDLEDQVAAL